MKRKLAFLLALSSIVVLNIPMSVTNISAWEDSLLSLSEYTLKRCISIPEKNKKISIPSFINTHVLASAISIIDYTDTKEDSAVIADDTDSSSNDQNTANTDTSNYDYIEDKKLHNGNPRVLIYHTHTTECFVDTPGEKPSSWRSTNPNKNLISVGSMVSQVIHDEYGIEVLHISDIFDKPYDTAYDKSYDAVAQAVKKYPSIEFIFDIHRDGLANNSQNRQVYLTNINGVDCARIMFVISTKSGYVDEIRDFSYELRSKMEEMYPTLYRRNMDRPYNYNMDFSPDSILIELGSNLSTVDEAKNTAVYLGRTIGELIKDRDNRNE